MSFTFSSLDTAWKSTSANICNFFQSAYDTVSDKSNQQAAKDFITSLPTKIYKGYEQGKDYAEKSWNNLDPKTKVQIKAVAASVAVASTAAMAYLKRENIQSLATSAHNAATDISNRAISSANDLKASVFGTNSDESKESEEMTTEEASTAAPIVKTNAPIAKKKPAKTSSKKKPAKTSSKKKPAKTSSKKKPGKTAKSTSKAQLVRNTFSKKVR